MLNKRVRSAGVSLLALMLLAGTGFAETFRIDKSHSNVAFSVRHIVSRVQGGFTGFSGTIQYDEKHPEKSTVEATIQTASINTHNERRDGHLRSPDFFDAAAHPEITFKSTKVKKQGDKLMVMGDFTLHGVTKQVMLPVEVLGVGMHPMSKAPVAGFAAELTIKRSDYGVNTWTDVAGVLGDEVKISLNIEAGATGGMAKAGNPCNPCGNACNPCGKMAKKNACNPCGKNACNPCNPCAKAKANPCNPCGM